MIVIFVVDFCSLLKVRTPLLGRTFGFVGGVKFRDVLPTGHFSYLVVSSATQRLCNNKLFFWSVLWCPSLSGAFNRAATTDALAAEGMSEEEVSKAVEDELARQREDDEVGDMICPPFCVPAFLDSRDRGFCCFRAVLFSHGYK